MDGHCHTSYLWMMLSGFENKSQFTEDFIKNCDEDTIQNIAKI